MIDALKQAVERAARQSDEEQTVLASIPLAALAGKLTIAQIYVVGLLSATAFVWFDAANFGALPALAGKERLVAANSAIWSSATVIAIVVPGPAALLATVWGSPRTISLDALSYACSAVALLLVPRAFQAARLGDTAPPEAALVRRTARRHPRRAGLSLAAAAGSDDGLAGVWQ